MADKSRTHLGAGRAAQGRPFQGDDAGQMTPAASVLAYRTAMTAGPFVDSLQGDLRQIACSLRHGDLYPALEALEASTDRLQRFLTYVVVASEVLMDRHASLGAVVANYGSRLLGVLGHIEETLDEGDLVGLALALEHGLVGSLEEYRGYEADVQRALSRVAAMQMAA